MINYTHRIYLERAGSGQGRINNNLRAAADVKNNIPGDTENGGDLMAMTIGKTNKGISARAGASFLSAASPISYWEEK
jgi:hypothetical protein